MEEASQREALKPWHDPLFGEWYGMRDERFRVQLNVEATKLVWWAYKEGKANRWWLVSFTLQGEVVPKLLPEKSEDLDIVVRIALHQRLCVYNVRRRKCWRPVWSPMPYEKRTLQNLTYESVELLGWQSFIEGWENRPRAKLFSND